MSKSKIFSIACICFALGVLLASRFNVDPRIVYVSLCLTAVLFAIGGKKLKVLALFVLFLSLGVWRFNFSVNPSEFAEFYDQKIKWEGYITEEPDVRADKQLITIRPIGFEQKLLVTTTKAQEFFYGDWVVVEGKIKQAKEFDDFDYPGYLERFNVYAIASYPKVLILKNNRGNFAKHALLKIKATFVKRASGFLPEPQNSLALGILIGARKGLPTEIVENFNITGTSHIIAISGFNITVIVAALGYLAWILGRRTSAILSFLVILGFVIITGGSASVV